MYNFHQAKQVLGCQLIEQSESPSEIHSAAPWRHTERSAQSAKSNVSATAPLSMTRMGSESNGSQAQADAVWADVLTSFNGTSITYDQIGNPLNWRDGATLTWQHGRELATYSKDGVQIAYTYNDNGIRTSKTVNGVKTTYILDENDRLVGEVTGENTTAFLYDESGCVYGFLYNGAPYYYLFNGQGDVISVVDEASAVVATYNYDAWGKVISETGTMAAINPIRYRGYYYDAETELYYLQSRYYDPIVL